MEHMNYSTSITKAILEARYYLPPVSTIGSSELEDELLQLSRRFGDNILAIRNWLLYKVLPDIYKEHIDWFFVKLEDRKSLVGNMRVAATSRLIKNDELPVYKFVKSKRVSDYLFTIGTVIIAIKEFYQRNPNSKEKPTLSPETYSSLMSSNKGRLPFLSHHRDSFDTSSLYPIEKVVNAIKRTNPIWTSHKVALDMVGSTSLVSAKNVGNFPLFLFDVFSDRWYKSARLSRDNGISPTNIIVKRSNSTDNSGSLSYNIEVKYGKQEGDDDSYTYTISGSVFISYNRVEIFYEDVTEFKRDHKGSGVSGSATTDKNIFTCGELVSILADKWDWWD